MDSNIIILDYNTLNDDYKDKSFNRLYKLQLLLKKESALKELCKINFFKFSQYF